MFANFWLYVLTEQPSVSVDVINTEISSMVGTMAVVVVVATIEGEVSVAMLVIVATGCK